MRTSPGRRPSVGRVGEEVVRLLVGGEAGLAHQHQEDVPDVVVAGRDARVEFARDRVDPILPHTPYYTSRVSPHAGQG